MEEEKNKSNLLSVIITILILVILFAGVLFGLSKSGYITFNFKRTEAENQNTQVEKVEKVEKADSNVTNTDFDVLIEKASTNMTSEEVVALWNSIKGNWANISSSADFDMCTGTSLEINTNVRIAKFNSDGITVWNIVSFEKIGDTKYKINLVLPVNLNNQMNGDIVASYNSITIDTGKPNDGKMTVNVHGTDIEYEYVGDNKVIVNESTHYQYIDGGFSQSQYCDWYKKNH